MKQEVIATKDGSKTLFIPQMDEQYHSVNGALTEARHVFIEAAYKHHPSPQPVVFEVGFGTGLNALLTALAAEEQNRKTLFISIEKYPVETRLLSELNYGKHISEKAERLFEQLHSLPWEEENKITDHFSLIKINSDLKAFDPGSLAPLDIVYFDAFGPDKQPNMWSNSVFNSIYKASALNSVITTYSAKGAIRRQMRDCGYFMERLPGPPGKRQMLRGTKKGESQIPKMSKI